MLSIIFEAQFRANPKHKYNESIWMYDLHQVKIDIVYSHTQNDEQINEKLILNDHL